MVNRGADPDGTIVSVRGSVVDVEFPTRPPPIRRLLRAPGDRLIEVQAHVNERTARGLSLRPTAGLARGMPVEDTGEGITVPVGDELLARILNVFGETIDREGPLDGPARWAVDRPPPPLVDRSTGTDIFLTGIKAIDLLAPLERGGNAGMLGGAGTGKTVLILEMIRNTFGRHAGVSIFCGIGERIREAEEVYRSLAETGVLEKTVLVFGQMDEQPGARLRVGHTALTIAEFFRDERRRDVLLLIDNIFRFVQAGSEVSGLMGQIPSRLGYQPTLATELAELEERICSTRNGAITSIQAVYVPADDFTDPAVVHTFGHLSASIVLSRERASEGLFPAIDPLRTDSKMLVPHVVGARHYRVAQEVRRVLASYEDLKDVIAMLGLEELSGEDRRTVARARQLERYLTQPFYVTEAFTGRDGRMVELDDALDDCERILGDELADVPESRLYLIGSLRELRRETDDDPGRAPGGSGRGVRATVEPAAGKAHGTSGGNR